MLDALEPNNFEKNESLEPNENENGMSLPEQEGVKPEEKQTKAEVIERLRTLINDPVADVKDEVDTLKQTYYKLRKAEIEEQRKNVTESVEEEESAFVPEADPLEETLKALLNEFKEKKNVYLLEQEKIKESNLIRKNEILQRIKEITEDTDNINKHYTEFQQLQTAFKEIVNIPQSQINEMWKNYQLYVETFYDLLKINKELRDYDFKKNLDQKIALCEIAEKLVDEEDVLAAFKSLQQLHDEWRGIGPVAKELREEIWTRFKTVSSNINKLHQQHFEALKGNEQKNEQDKIALCEAIEAISLADLKSFNAWDEKTKEIIELQDKWKSLGFAPRKVNAQLFERFRKSCDEFFKQKAEYFKSVKEEMSRNLEMKRILCEKAESLKDSTDWKNTTDVLISIQKEWKSVGPVAKKYSDQIWKRFIAACDYFFEQKEKNTSSQKAEEQENLKRKKEIIEKLHNIDASLDPAEAIKIVKELMSQWSSIGFVPFKEKDKLYKEYQNALDVQFGRLNMHENKRRLNTFSSSIQQMSSSEGDLLQERRKLMRTFEHMKQELQTYENNIGFLTLSSKSSGGLLKEMERKIQKLKEDLEMVAQKIQMIDEKL